MVSHRPRLAAGTLVAASLLIAAACSGDDDAASTTTVQATTTAAPTTSAPPTTAPETTSALTTVAAPTTAEPTTVASTSPPETTGPEPTTTTLPEGVPPRVTFPDDEDKQAVVDAYYAWNDLDAAVLANPQDEVRVAELLSQTAEPLRKRVEELVDQLASDGEAYVANPDQPAYTEVLDFTVLIVDDSASFDGCSINALVHVRAADGEVTEVLDDSISSSLLTYNLRRTDGEWLVSDIVRVERWEDQVGCG